MATDKKASEELNDELQRLYREFVVALEKAGDALNTHGMNSPEFEQADRAAGESAVK